MTRLLAACSVVLVILSRLAHLRLVWIEEAYGMAAAAAMLHGRQLYSQIWFDKPPIYAWFYLLCGAQQGWPLRILDMGAVLAAAAAVGLIARELWGGREGVIAACLVCFFLTFWIPSAVIAVAPDILIIIPHAVAVWFGIRKQPWLAGVFAGVAVLCNSKGLLVLAAVLIWTWPTALKTLAAFTAVQGAVLLFVSPAAYWREVWEWGWRYSADTFLASPALEGARRTASWMWFHAALCVGAILCLVRERRLNLALWLGLSALGVVAGWRFFPRYYFVLLPVMSVLAARGFVWSKPAIRIVLVLLLLIPAVRFGPRYVQLMLHGTQGWSDVALMEDSRRAASILQAASAQGDSILVWGYRPDIFVFSGLPPATQFLDSQPLTGVLADRHLFNSSPAFPDLARQNRRRLAQTSPPIVVDGLGLLNPSLAIEAFPDLRAWLSRYQRIGHTQTTVIYQLRSGPDGSAPAKER